MWCKFKKHVYIVPWINQAEASADCGEKDEILDEVIWPALVGAVVLSG